jgi:hypothetical protein
MEAIGSAGSLPSGELYAVLMSGLPGYSLTRHNLLIAKLIGEGFATETNNLLSLTKDGKVVLARTQAILGVTDLLTSMKGKSHV